MIFVITGQTATGKTKLALEYAAKYNGELVNCDSRQIYKKLDIITGKDVNESQKLDVKFYKITSVNNFGVGYYPLATNYQRLTTKLWLYDIIDPKQYFSSYDFVQCAQFVIKDIVKRGKTPIIIGGTGLYLKHLLYGFDYSVPPNWSLRKNLERKTLIELQSNFKSIVSRLSHQSPPYPIWKRASSLPKLLIINDSDFNNPRRLIRRIEILSSPKKMNINKFQPISTDFNRFKLKLIGLKYKYKTDLIKAIKIRVEKRLKQGAIEEVKNLLAQGYTEDDPGLKTIGYQQIIEYLKCKGRARPAQTPKNQMINQWITAEVQYAKRQVTYLKKLPNINWVEI